MLGVVNLKMGNKAEAKTWFTTLLDFKVVKQEDKDVSEDLSLFYNLLYVVPLSYGIMSN